MYKYYKAIKDYVLGLNNEDRVDLHYIENIMKVPKDFLTECLCILQVEGYVYKIVNPFDETIFIKLDTPLHKIIHTELSESYEKHGFSFVNYDEFCGVLLEELHEVAEEVEVISILSNHIFNYKYQDNDVEMFKSIKKLQPVVNRALKELAQVGAVLLKVQN